MSHIVFSPDRQCWIERTCGATWSFTCDVSYRLHVYFVKLMQSDSTKCHVNIERVPWHDCTSLNVGILTWIVEVAHFITNSLAYEWVESSTWSMLLFYMEFTSSDKQIHYWQLTRADCFLLDKFFFSFNKHVRHVISFLILCTFLVIHSPITCVDNFFLDIQTWQVNFFGTSCTLLLFYLTLILNFVPI